MLSGMDEMLMNAVVVNLNDVRLNASVFRVAHTDSGVSVEYALGNWDYPGAPSAATSASPVTITAQYAIVAVPVGVLAAQDAPITFSPPLPTSMALALANLTTVAENHVMLWYDEVWWTQENDWILPIATDACVAALGNEDEGASASGVAASTYQGAAASARAAASSVSEDTVAVVHRASVDATVEAGSEKVALIQSATTSPGSSVSEVDSPAATPAEDAFSPVVAPYESSTDATSSYVSSSLNSWYPDGLIAADFMDPPSSYAELIQSAPSPLSEYDNPYGMDPVLFKAVLESDLVSPHAPAPLESALVPAAEPSAEEVFEEAEGADDKVVQDTNPATPLSAPTPAAARRRTLLETLSASDDDGSEAEVAGSADSQDDIRASVASAPSPTPSSPSSTPLAGTTVSFLDLSRFTGKPMLLARIAGIGAEAAEALDDEPLAAALGQLLLTWQEGTGTAPTPRAVRSSRWASDPLSRGAHSVVRPGGTPAARSTLAQPASGALAFAGEALSSSLPGSIEGAIASGLAAARFVFNARNVTERKACCQTCLGESTCLR